MSFNEVFSGDAASSSPPLMSSLRSSTISLVSFVRLDTVGGAGVLNRRLAILGDGDTAGEGGNAGSIDGDAGRFAGGDGLLGGVDSACFAGRLAALLSFFRAGMVPLDSVNQVIRGISG